ncbi:cytochrome c-type biogenesis protein CcmI [Bisgaardia hudsonensis]|uniref:Cytochrome c-type biogenesis protein CcmI n=1 Tax=Bisgaardia hudsonensis TaxID=109472 RepID=A0A4V2SJA9_9PAST|nr:c-type cytochrome biogenesis protein CcmI [Bisgaardia hudsonensis]QLB12511.1 c-type cytochrome biogenesis protein CcmI [Bisgaardia hudsonensis]TCP14050.1 cytochrome c-type biogenesis protein CcmI [Bisgaardia hudsonensis]
MNFWIITSLLTFAIALLCFYPLLQKKLTKQESVDRDKLNKTFYFNRLQELEEDEQQGLISNSEQLKTELQQSLLQDIPLKQKEVVNNNTVLGKIWFVSGFLGLLIISTLSYTATGSWKEEMMLEKTVEKLPHFYERLKEEETKPLDDSELQQFIIALRLKLQKEPNNAEDWWLLGQVAMAQENGQLAHDSYGRAYKLDPNNIRYKISYAQLLMLANDEADKIKGTTLLREVLRVEHTNLQALSLLAFQYFEREDYKMAVATWSMMLRLLPKDDPRVEVLKKSIHMASENIK